MLNLFKLFRFFEGAPREEHQANIDGLVALFRLPIEDELCARPDVERSADFVPVVAQPQLVRARS